MTSETTVTTSWNALSDVAQDLLRHDRHLYTAPAWLQVEQQAHPGGHRYLAANTDGASAAAAAYRFDVTNNPWPAARPDMFVAEQTGKNHEQLPELLPGWVLGGRRPGHTHLPTGGNPQGRREVLTRLLDVSATTAADDGAATVSALYCDSDDTDLAAAFAAYGAVAVPSPGLNTLPLAAGGWEGWLAGLPRKRRVAELADARKLTAAGVHLSLQPLTAADIDEIVPLELCLYQKYGHDYRADEARGLHLAYLEHLGSDALLVRAERAGRLIGFVSVVRSGTTAYLRQAGFDASSCDGIPVYFGAVFHEPIRWASTAGVRALDLSTSMDQVKQRRGAVTSARQAWIIPLTHVAETALRSRTHRLTIGGL